MIIETLSPLQLLSAGLNYQKEILICVMPSATIFLPVTPVTVVDINMDVISQQRIQAKFQYQREHQGLSKAKISTHVMVYTPILLAKNNHE
jgi:hypothetical protein